MCTDNKGDYATTPDNRTKFKLGEQNLPYSGNKQMSNGHQKAQGSRSHRSGLTSNETDPCTPVKKSALRTHRKYHESSFWQQDDRVIAEEVDYRDESQESEASSPRRSLSPFHANISPVKMDNSNPS